MDDAEIIGIMNRAARPGFHPEYEAWARADIFSLLDELVRLRGIILDLNELRHQSQLTDAKIANILAGALP